MAGVFYIVGPTAAGKSALAAEVAGRLEAEVVNADAFQVYQGFDVLSGKPDPETLRKVPHHLVGTVPVTEEMSAAKYRALALPVIGDINARGKLALVVGGSGLYIKALTHGLDQTPAPDAELREELSGLTLDDLRARLIQLDPHAAQQVDMKNRRRVVRALEIAVSSGMPVSAQRTRWEQPTAVKIVARGGSQSDGSAIESKTSAGGRCHDGGVFVFRDREDLYERINKRVEAMLDGGAIEEVRGAGELSRTAEQMIGVSDIRKYLANNTSLGECLTSIQQATRRYAKRQLTWFRRQTNFEALNLSLLNHNEAVESILRRALAGRPVND